MTQTPVKKLVCTLAVPTIISMLVTSFYNMADTFFVGRIGTSATGAVGVVFSLMAVIQAIGFTFGHGSGNYVSRALGRQDMENASRMVSTGFFSALFFGAGVSVLGLIFLDPLVRILGATPTILPYARGYAAYILLGAPYMTATLGQFTRNYTQTVKRAADNKRRYASDRGIAPVCWGVSKGGSAPFGTRLCEAKCSVLYALPALP